MEAKVKIDSILTLSEVEKGETCVGMAVENVNKSCVYLFNLTTINVAIVLICLALLPIYLP